MTTPLPISFFPFLLLIATICFTICDANTNLLCIQSEIEALLKFKNDLIDPSNRLSSWVEGGDCCEWIGIVCHNSTGHVNQLHLAAPPLSAPDFDAPLAEREAYERSKLRGKINPSLLELKHLSSLDFSNNNFSSIQIPEFLGMLRSLTYLNLSYEQFQGGIPHNLGNLSSLHYLDLGGNDLEPESLQWVSELSSLQYLDLSYVNLSKANDWIQAHSNILLYDPSSINANSTKSLLVLDISGNNFSSILKSIFSLHGLLSIDLSGNSLEGPIPDNFGNTSFLEVLDLSWNHLNSSIPNSLYSLNRLQFLRLRDSQLQGTISSSIGNLSSVTHLELSENQLNGQIPLSIGELSSLNLFDVSENNLNGQIPLSIRELSSLKFFDVSENQLNVPRILDVMLTWFFNLPTQFEYLNLSFNQLIGEISYLNVTSSIDLSSNRFIGPLPRVLSSLIYLFLSNNSFLEFLFELICNSYLMGMIGLYIDTNLLIEEIPDCWNHWEFLAYLNLGNNNLTGKIPLTLGYTNLFMLNLRNNSMFGQLPSTLQNSGDLVMLDLSGNHFSGSVLAWIGDKLSSLVILSLRSNNFDGHIPHKICDLQFLQNLDLGHNNISGVIPKCFSNLSAMATKNKTNNEVSAPIKIDYYRIYFKALLVLKGRRDKYGSTLGLVTSIDLSTNSLTREIPKEISSLVGLLSLNFSGNLLTGNIPDNIGNMELMESLDLSMNRLNGEIPPSFSNLNFLNHFNNCTSKGIPTGVANNGSKVNWLYVSIVLGFVTGFWGVVAPLFFIRSWRIAYYRKLDHIYGKLFLFWATMGM
ncbi:hypothetical protein ES319_A11G313900v1 [Gossypium barbadense]|uniref:Leucine-rich repeat-containing N-terminal plant-type domain-containing protein n=1 Tax=Gossypium barbadense TaxID=3634 RepID=A0A5J5TXN6_GOSBA|nr:hypothetical protein ES319_A11G313900v1 [Gossypium barbadense]